MAPAPLTVSKAASNCEMNVPHKVCLYLTSSNKMNEHEQNLSEVIDNVMRYSYVLYNTVLIIVHGCQCRIFCVVDAL